MQRHKMFVTIVILLFVVLASVVIVSVSRQSSSDGRVSSLVDPPLSLEPDDMGGSGARGTMTIRAGGEAALQGFPIGVVETNNDQLCLAWDGVATYSGEARWSADVELMITITTTAGRTVIGPYNPPFGDVVGYKFGVPRCGGEETMWYWTSSESLR